VKTGDVKGAGTDANVYVYLFGENGDSGKITSFLVFYYFIII